jgi:hypothetical protein
VDIACGWEHSVALKSNGTVVTWGGNYPATPANLTGVTAIASTAHYPASHTLALKSNGTVVAWGLPETSPRLQVPANLTGVIGIAAGPDYSLAWKADGTLVRFGIEDPTANLPAAPTSIPGIIAAAIGGGFFIALKNNGIVDGYGRSTDIPGSSYGDAKFLPKKEGRTIFFAFGEGVPVIQPNQTFTGKVGTALNAQLVFSNTMHRPVTSVSATGLPSWATINDRSIVGTPTAIGNSTVTLTPTGPAGTGAATTATLSISAGAPLITSGQSFNGRVGQSFSATPELTNASGRPATSWSATGLPAGLTINATTGVISGTPTSSGSITANLTASSSAGSSGATAVQFVIAVAMTLPVITSGQSFSAIVGYTNWIPSSDPFSEYIALTVETYRSETSWAIASGVLPTGLTLNATTGEISGTTIATGIFTVSVVASNSIGASVPKQIVITIFDGIPRIQQGKTYLGRVGVAFSATPTLNDVEFAPAVSFFAAGLPSWATINTTTGVITGTPDVFGKTDFHHWAKGLRGEAGVLTHIEIESGIPIFAGAVRATAIYAGAVAAKALYYGAKKLWPPPQHHEILESLATINPADGSRGHSKFLDTGLNLAASNLTRIGFKFAAAVRIKNATITTTAGTYTLGVATNWTLVKYFASHDLTITTDGIGRSGFGNIGNGWDADVCGFWVDIPASSLTASDKITVDYEYIGAYAAKHGVAFWNATTTAGGTVESYMGTWDNTPLVRMPTTAELPRIVVTAQASLLSNTLCRRRVIIRNNP